MGRLQGTSTISASVSKTLYLALNGFSGCVASRKRRVFVLYLQTLGAIFGLKFFGRFESFQSLNE